MSRALQVVPFVIPNGTSISNVQNLESFQVKAIAMPVGWTAATLTFISSPDDPTSAIQSDRPGTGAPFPMQSVRDQAGAEVAVTVAAAQFFLLGSGAAALDGLGFTQVVSGPNAAQVNQGAQRIIRFLCAVRG